MTGYSKSSSVNHAPMGTCCGPNHVWIYTHGTTSGKVPSGTPCQCLRMVAHYTICEGCGSQKFEAIDTHKRENDDD